MKTRAEIKKESREKLKTSYGSYLGVSAVEFIIVAFTGYIIFRLNNNLDFITTVVMGLLEFGLIICYREIRDQGKYDMGKLFAGVGKPTSKLLALILILSIPTLLANLFQYIADISLVNEDPEMAILNLFLVLCFLIISIVVKLFYYWTTYILVDNPDMTIGEVLTTTRKLTKDHVGDLFVYGLSWILWALAVGISCGLALLYVGPYMSLTTLNLYEEYRNEVFPESQGEVRWETPELPL